MTFCTLADNAKSEHIFSDVGQAVSEISPSGNSMSDQRVFCNDLLRFALNLASLLTFNIFKKMRILSYVSRVLFEI